MLSESDDLCKSFFQSPLLIKLNRHFGNVTMHVQIVATYAPLRYLCDNELERHIEPIIAKNPKRGTALTRRTHRTPSNLRGSPLSDFP